MPLDTVFHTGGLVWRGKRQPMPLDTVFHTGGLVWGRGKRQPMPLDTVFHTGGLVRGRGRDNLCLYTQCSIQEVWFGGGERDYLCL